MYITIGTTLTVFITSVLCQRVVSGLVAQTDDPMTCLEAEIRCHGDVQCRALLDNVPNVCDDDVEACDSPRYQLCFNILSSLQKTYHFRGCVCNNMDIDATNCMHLKKTIYQHACLHKVLASNSSYSLPPQLPSFMRTRGDLPVTVGDLELLMEGREESCIAIRKNCLVDVECNRTLEEFREFCRESKKQGICVTSHREECFEAIESLQSSGLFSCHCDQIEKLEPREKCDRIQYRVANNTCLVDVPYFVYSTRKFKGYYNDLVDMVSGNDSPESGNDVTTTPTSGTFPTSTCVQAFMACNSDSTCVLRMAEFLNACTWHKQSNTCDKPRCLQAIQKFFLLVRPEHTHALLFCRCEAGDDRCRSIQRAVYPACSVVDSPPPSCLDILEQCQQDLDCRVRLQAYVTHCHYDKKLAGCTSGVGRCRSAQVEIMGTVLTTNCTCSMQDQEQLRECLHSKDVIQHHNLCKEMALNDFHKQTATVGELPVWNDGVQYAERHDCQRYLGQHTPPFLNIPSVIRRYRNDSDCSDVCQCLRNGTLMCTALPCKPSLICKYGDIVFEHGATFIIKESERGECRCIKSELVCAKASDDTLAEAGLFLHVGYSLSDMYLVEAHSSVKFQPEQISQKLGALMNGDSAEQFCSFTLHTQLEGNLIFQIRVSDVSPKVSNQGTCTTLAKSLSYKINVRDRVIINDAELSILKVAELENITIHEPPKPPSLEDIGLSLSSRPRTGSAVSCCNSSCLLQLSVWLSLSYLLADIFR